MDLKEYKWLVPPMVVRIMNGSDYLDTFEVFRIIYDPRNERYLLFEEDEPYHTWWVQDDVTTYHCLPLKMPNRRWI